jgi:hypothetical protein
MARKIHWIESGIEPSVDDLLAEPIVQALMQADGIAARDVIVAIGQAAHPRPCSCFRTTAGEQICSGLARG